jgi:hypothetical protein
VLPVNSYIKNQITVTYYAFLMQPSIFSEEAITGLHLTPPREADSLTRIMFQKNSFLLQGSKIIILNM